MKDCDHPSCTIGVSLDTLACKKHWFELPAALRAQVWRTWRKRKDNPGDAAARDAHESAKTAALLYWSQAA